MYKCKYCEKEYTDKGNLRKHEKNIHEQPQQKIPCPYCNKLITPGGTLIQHTKSCINNPNRKLTKQELRKLIKMEQEKQPGICQFCSKECHNQNSLRNHERLCKENSFRRFTSIGNGEWPKGRPAWNKGLTKETDERVKHIAEGTKQGIARAKIEHPEYYTGIASTEEKELVRRQKLSEYAKNKHFGGHVHGSGRGKKGWYKGFFCDSTYELVYVIYNIDNNIKFKRCDRVYTYIYKNETHKYYPDFELEDGSLVETKGYHTELVDIKKSAVKDRQISILYEKDLKYAFDWVKDHYTYKQLSDLYE